MDHHLIDLLESNAWPKAVPDRMIVDEASEEQKQDRSEGILYMLLPNLDDKKFLDFGCGEGHIAQRATELSSPKLSVGYDIKRQGELKWEQSDNLLTTDFQSVSDKGKYDVILMYDVIDHTDDPKAVLAQVQSLMHSSSVLYMRCHPWCGRHGGHLYQWKNKAFTHLVFTVDELKAMGASVEEMPPQQVMHPKWLYERWIKGVPGLKISTYGSIDTPVEKFFANDPALMNRIVSRWKGKSFDERLSGGKSKKMPAIPMQQDFVDVQLKCK